MIEIKNVTVVKHGETLFRNFNFAINEGEHWLIEGANGSGKTTLLHLIAGIQVPMNGEVVHHFVEGADWDTRYQQRREKIHFIPTHWIGSALSGFDDLFYQQRYYAVEEIDLPKVSDIFGADLAQLKNFSLSGNFDISHLLNLHVTRLSNGQLKKVIILRQLVRSIPRILMLDYPFDGLDAASRQDLVKFLDELSTEFRLQLIIADHGRELPSVINRKLVLENYTIASQGAFQPSQQNAQVTSSFRTEGSDGEPVVEMRDLTIRYGSRDIISHLNWRVNRGDRWALTGANGSGKTTLFSLIYADHPMAYSQQVFLFGKRRGSGESIWDVKNRINYLGPEQIHFLDQRTRGLTGKQYIRAQHGGTPERLSALIDFFNASHYIDAPLRQLSSGQLQMVLLINMFLDNKELLLLDEPFQFLDEMHHERVTAYLNNYLDEDVTLILITHDERDVSRWTQFRKIL